MLICQENYRKISLDLVDVLWRPGADETMVNNEGETAAEIARSLGGWSHEDSDRLDKMLINAAVDRAWRRRALLVL